MIKDSKPNTLLLEDSIVAGLSRCPNVWNEYLAQINALNLGIGGDCIQYVLWRAINLPLPSSVKHIVILCRTSNIPIDTTRNIANCIISIGAIFQKNSDGINVSVCGLIPCDERWSVGRVLINEVNKILKYQCNINGFAFIFQDHGWTLANGFLDYSLFYKVLLHLIEQGNVKLAKPITLTITPRYINLSSTNSNTSCSDITRQKLQATIYFLLNERNFLLLSNVCQPILSNVSGSRLYQRKPASNMKLVSIHVSPVYADSFSEFVKLLNVSKPTCSSNATKRNVGNASSVDQFTKPLNVSKTVCPSKATKRNVCNASSVSQLIKPLNVNKTICSNDATERKVCKVSSVSQLVKSSIVSKPACSNNVTKRNVRNATSISQLVKTFNVTKSVCSSNANNPVICNSTCKPVSNFVSDCQSFKHVYKLIDVNQKRPHERLVNNKSSHQHFTQKFNVVNILIMSIYFYELVFLFFIFHHNFCNNNIDNIFNGYVRCNSFSTNEFLTFDSFIYHEFISVAIFNIPHTNVLSSLHRFYHFSFSSYKYLLFINSVFITFFM